MARGDNLQEAHRFEFAAKAYHTAGDAVRATYNQARHLYQQAAELAGDPASESRQQTMFLDVRCLPPVPSGAGLVQAVLPGSTYACCRR